MATAELLTAIHGIGRWTVEMLLILTLGRLDVLTVNDIGAHDDYCAFSAPDEPDKESQTGVVVPGCQRKRVMSCACHTPPLAQRSGRQARLSHRRGRRAPRQRE
jgi:3-methyladenine DNA glycosylase/8-oxoguanine DNA glycosylase